MAEDSRLVVPIGQFGGRVRDAGTGQTRYTVRRGHDLWSVEPVAGRLWLDAHGRADELEQTAWTRAAVVGRRREESATAYGYLVDHGLVVEIDPQGPAAVDFARTHRLVARAHGMGNRPAEPSRFMAGYPPHEVAGFSWFLYRLWRQGHLEPTLWDGCCALAARPESVRQQLDARALLTETLVGVHILLATRVAYLDVARLPEDAGPETHRPDMVTGQENDPDDLVVPAGHDMGPFFPDVDKPFSFYEVCVGRTTYALPTNDDYAVWMRAHGPVDDPPLTYTRYRNNLIGDGIPDAEGLAYRLATNGLLWQIPSTGGRAVAFARAHRIVSLVTAIGNVGPGVPARRYALGRPDVVFHYADELEYWLWLWGGRFDSLWLACEAVARTEVGSQTGDGDPYRCIGPVLLAVQNMINRSLVFLDACWDRR